MEISVIPGYSSPSTWPWEPIIRVLPEKGNLLEAGTYCGLSASIWAEKLPNYMVHTVEIASGVPSPLQVGIPFKGLSNPMWISKKEQLNFIHQVVKNHENLSFSKGDFFKMQIPEPFDNPDVFFYDADHDPGKTIEALNKFKHCPNIVVDDCQMKWIKEEVLLFVEENSRNLKLFKTKFFEVAVIQ